MSADKSWLHVLGRGLAHPGAGLYVLPIAWALIFAPLYLTCGLPSEAPQLGWVSTMHLPEAQCNGAWAGMILIFVVPALLTLIFVGPTIWFRNTVVTTINVPLIVCSKFIRNARNLVHYEQKVAGCSVITGGFRIWGSWCGLPYDSDYDMKFTSDGGFHSSLRTSPFSEKMPSLMKIIGSGGFKTFPDPAAQLIKVDIAWTSDSCGACTSPKYVEVPPTKLVHYESYGWPITFPLLFWVAPFWRYWHRRGMEVEIELIKIQIEQMFRETEKNPITSEMLADQSALEADYPLLASGRWADWKYGGHESMKEMFAQALCRPYKAHHPVVRHEIKHSTPRCLPSEQTPSSKRRRLR